MRKAKKGRIKNVQSIIIDGILFRSRLESFAYMELKKAGIKFDSDNFVLKLYNVFGK